MATVNDDAIILLDDFLDDTLLALFSPVQYLHQVTCFYRHVMCEVDLGS